MFTTECDLRVMGPDLWMVINQPLVWDGDTPVEVPVGFITDLASIPPPFRNVLNRNGRSRKPAVIHDWLYSNKKLTRAQCDEIFRQVLIAEGVKPGVAKWVYWLGVRAGGWWSWGNKTPDDKGPSLST